MISRACSLAQTHILLYLLTEGQLGTVRASANGSLCLYGMQQGPDQGDHNFRFRPQMCWQLQGC